MTTPRTALITGASSGIGEATAIRLGSEGFRLILCARRLDRLEEAAKSARAAGSPDIHLVELDVRERASVTQKIQTLPAAWRSIDILVNNAGLGVGRDPIQEGSPDDWDLMIDTNLKGLLNVTHAVLPFLLQSPSGQIINVGSIAGLEEYPNGNVYCATKAAVDSLTRGMQMDLVKTPIRVSSVDPGMVETEFSITRYKGDRRKAAQVYENFKPLQAQDVADVIAFMATRPTHVNLRQVVLLPTHQASAQVIHRGLPEPRVKR